MIYNAATSKKAAPIRPNPIPIFSAPLGVTLGVEVAPELEEEAELADEAAEADEAEEAEEVVEAAAEAEDEAALVAAAPDPVEVSWADRREPTLDTQVPATLLPMS